MSIYHNFIKLSIAIVSLASILLNFIFPHVALANEVKRSNVLSFDYSKGKPILSYNISNKTIASDKIGDLAVGISKEQKIYKLPIEQIIQVQTLGKMIVAEASSENIPQDNDSAVLLGDARDKIAESICINAGIAAQPCWQDLKAMREKESYDGKTMVGDSGRSRGWYHIQTKMHKISVECALDFQCSTEWTVKYLIANGYETNRAYAISKHNGSGNMAQVYAKSIIYNSAKFSR